MIENERIKNKKIGLSVQSMIETQNIISGVEILLYLFLPRLCYYVSSLGNARLSNVHK